MYNATAADYPLTAHRVAPTIQMMFTWQAFPLLISMVSLAACSSSDEAPVQGQPDIDAAVLETEAPDARKEEAEAGIAEASNDAPTDGPVIAATDAGTKFTFSLNATGEGVKVKSLAMLGNAGTLSLGGVPHTGVAFESHAWTGAGWDIFDVLSIADDGSNLAVTFLYCKGSELTHFYFESLTDKMTVETAAGTCEALQQETPVNVSLPALKASPSALDTGITIDGADVHLDATGGTMTMASQTWRLVPFGTVDCTQCPGGPWLEIHSLLLGEQQGCFSILYLWPNDKTKVEAAYTLCLPSLERPTAMLEATWDGVLLQSLAQPPLPRPAPPAH